MKISSKIMKYFLFPFISFILLLVVTFIGLGLSVKLPGEHLTPSGMVRYNSQYVTMRDGVEIAVDVWLPEDYNTGQKLPTLIHATRYGRAFNVRFPYRVMMALGQVGPLNYKRGIQKFNENGYVMVRIDARGSGASYGERLSDLVDDELMDYDEIIEWIIKQPWSNGKVGAMGVSYPGMTAEMMTMTNHPALVAVAPLYTYFDVYQHLSHPGGVYDKYFMEGWSHLTEAMDENRCFIYGSDFDCWKFMTMVGGIRPVNGPEGEKKLKEAYTGRDNPTVLENLVGFEYRDDLFGRAKLHVSSPHLKAETTSSSGVVMNVWSGWYDSANVDGAIARFKTLSNKQKVIIGAFSHGGSHDTSSFAEVKRKPIPVKREQKKMIMDFFDLYLKEGKSPLEGVHEIQYLTLGEDKYHTTSVWPPKGINTQRWVFGEKGTLDTDVSTLLDGEAFDTYKVDFTATTGKRSRWHSIGGPDIVYPNRQEEDKKLLTYTSKPLEQNLEITGAPQVTLNLASTHTDGALHIYLETVAPDGTVTYITEGILSLKNRAISKTSPYVVDTVYHPLNRANAKPMVPAVAENIVVPLYNISVLLKKGNKIRIAIAGADKDTFQRIPDTGNPILTINRSKTHPSFVDLPQKWQNSGFCCKE